jgi:hypothetical protein
VLNILFLTLCLFIQLSWLTTRSLSSGMEVWHRICGYMSHAHVIAQNVSIHPTDFNCTLCGILSFVTYAIFTLCNQYGLLVVNTRRSLNADVGKFPLTLAVEGHKFFHPSLCIYYKKCGRRKYGASDCHLTAGTM